MTWGDRLARMRSAVVSDRGPSVWASYYAPGTDAPAIRVKGVYESPYSKQPAQDFDSEMYVVEQDPRLGIRTIDIAAVQDAELTIDIEPGKRFRVMKIEDAEAPGWVDLVLELISES